MCASLPLVCERAVTDSTLGKSGNSVYIPEVTFGRTVDDPNVSGRLRVLGGMTVSWEDQLRELVHARGTALLRYAYVLCGDQARAEDLVQGALTRTFARRRSVQDPEAYVRRAILTGYLDEQRRAGIFRRRQPVLVTPAVHLDPPVEDRRDIEAALALLSTQQRACITLRYLCDQPVDEIARLIGCSPGNVKRHLHDGLSRLRGALEPRQEHEHG